MQPQMNDDGARALAAAILSQAHKDYVAGRKFLCGRGTERFLPSQWCQFLCECLELDHKLYIQVTKEKREKFKKVEGAKVHANCRTS